MVSFRRLALVTLAPLALAACGGGGGNVAIELTDAPPDLSTLERVDVSIGEVSIHVVSKSADDGAKVDDSGTGEDDATDDKGGQWVTVNPHAGTFDLLQLQNDVTSPLGDIDLPSGKVTQIRLRIDPQARNAVVLEGGQECALDLSELDDAGVKIRQPFKAIEPPSGGRVKVVVDFDVKESVDQLDTCSFKLKPAIKIKSTEYEDEVEVPEGEYSCGTLKGCG